MKEINLIIAAMDEEVQALLDNVCDYQIMDIDSDRGYCFTLNEETYILVKGYIGKSNTSFLLGKLSKLLNIKRVFNIGTSGGIDKSLKINDVIIATMVGYYDVDVSFFNYQKGQMPGAERYFKCDEEYLKDKSISSRYSIKRGIILSGDTFVTKDNFNNIPYEFNDCLSCDMEAGAIGHICNRLKIPFIVIRSISDTIFETIDKNQHDDDVKSSSTNSALILLELIK